MTIYIYCANDLGKLAFDYMTLFNIKIKLIFDKYSTSKKYRKTDIVPFDKTRVSNNSTIIVASYNYVTEIFKEIYESVNTGSSLKCFIFNDFYSDLYYF